jgi:signal transduction histidine kinase
MDKISTLIEDLLNLSRMNEGQLKLDKTKFTIAHMLNQCCSHVRVAGKHELVLQGDEELEVIADEHRVDQVIVNMVNNAVKYAPNSKQIFFNVEKLGSMARISVRDTGPGIAPDKLSHLFERYYRTDASGYQNSGLGLGLYISAEIIRKHGGEIGVDSELGKGSTFWFTLPL